MLSLDADLAHNIGTAIHGILRDNVHCYRHSLQPKRSAQSLPRGLTLSWWGSFSRFWWQAEKKSTTTLSIQALPKGHSPSMKATCPPLQWEALHEALYMSLRTACRLPSA